MNSTVHGDQFYSCGAKLSLETPEDPWPGSVMETNVVIAYCSDHLDIVRCVEERVKSLDVHVKLLVGHPFSLVEQVAQEDDQLRPEECHGCLKGAMHLPFPARFVEPVAAIGTQ